MWDRAEGALRSQLEELIQLSLSTLAGNSYELVDYFGRDIGLCYDQLSQQLFNMLQVPLLKVRFERRNGAWRVQTLTALGVATPRMALLEPTAPDSMLAKRSRKALRPSDRQRLTFV